jgi:hypothetical protein
MYKRDQEMARKLFEDDTRQFEAQARRVDDHKRQLEERRASLMAGGAPCSPTKPVKFEVPPKPVKMFDVFSQKVLFAPAVKNEPVASSSKKSGEDTLREAKMRGEDIMRQSRILDALRHEQDMKAGRVWKPQFNPAMNNADAADDADPFAGFGVAKGDGPTDFTSMDEKKHIEKLFKGIETNDSAVVTPKEQRLSTPAALRVQVCLLLSNLTVDGAPKTWAGVDDQV